MSSLWTFETQTSLLLVAKVIETYYNPKCDGLYRYCRPLSELINANSHVPTRALIRGPHMTFKFELCLCAFTKTTVHHPVVSKNVSFHSLVFMLSQCIALLTKKCVLRLAHCLHFKACLFIYFFVELLCNWSISYKLVAFTRPQ